LPALSFYASRSDMIWQGDAKMVKDASAVIIKNSGDKNRKNYRIMFYEYEMTDKKTYAMTGKRWLKAY
jgi:hypothetical protein